MITSTSFAHPRLQRSLAAVYRFYDAFHFPVGDTTPPIVAPLEVSIPELRWSALRVEEDATYRFSALTSAEPVPTGVNLDVQVRALHGDYVTLDPILLTLPLPLSTPVRRTDFLILQRLWPTPAMRPPRSETAVHGQIRSATAQPIAGLTVEMWQGAPAPPPGTPFTRTNATGEFLFRLPLLKGTLGSSLPFRIRLDAGAVAVAPAVIPLVLGTIQTVQFDRP